MVMHVTTTINFLMSMATGDLLPTISKEKRSNVNHLVLTDRVFEYNYLKEVVEGLFASVGDG